MDSLNQKSSTKIRLLCPKGHDGLFKDGITVGKLYKNYGIRLTETQVVKNGYDWDALERKMNATLEKEGFVVVDWKAKQLYRSKLLDLCPVYQLTEKQFSWITGRKCRECE